MPPEEFAREQESGSGASGEASLDRFLQTIAALKESWAVKTRRSSFHPFATWTREGPRLGAATLLARKGAGEEGRLLALLSIAYSFAVSANTLKHLAWAEREFDRGDFAKSAMHVSLTGLPPLSGSEAARRLHIAAGILDHGFLTPLGLLKACGFDCAEIESLAKSYNPDEPRVPKGNPDGGQWTRDGTKGPARITVAQAEPPIMEPFPAPEPGPPASAPVGSSRVPIEIQRGTNKPARIGDTPYTGHAIDRLQGRGIPPSAVADTIQNGETSPGDDPGTTAHYSQTNNLTVYTNNVTGNVITVHKGRP
jgi:hypothetical protein